MAATTAGTESVAGASSPHEKSLGLLATKFVTLLQEAKDSVLDLKVFSVAWIYCPWCELCDSRSIVGRRFLFIMGTLCLYRMLTTYVTVLPVPSQNIICENKVNGDWEVVLKQTFKLMSNGGLFLRRSPTFCGDYMYSGQAATLILTYLFTKTYSPGIFWLYHLFCWLLAVTGVISVMFTHTHYTLDVVAAYFVTTRIFWWYHTLANNQCLKTSSPQNGLSQVWWFRVFIFCEENVRAPVPQSYSWPISCSLLQDCTLFKKNKRTIKKWLNVGNGQLCEK